MRNFIFVLCLLLSLSCFAQEPERIEIEGNVIVPAGFEAGRITIFNSTANRGTVTSEEGDFILKMAAGDTLFFSALQFRELKVIISEEDMDAGHLVVEVSEGVNELPEIVIRPHDLTGNLNEDLENIEVVEIDLPRFVMGDMHFQPDAQSAPQNAAMGNPGGGANILGLLGAAVNLLLPPRKHKPKQEIMSSSVMGTIKVEQKLRTTFDDNFFRDNLQIPETRISEFIAFCVENEFDAVLLDKGKDLDLIQYLMIQAELFRKSQDN